MIIPCMKSTSACERGGSVALVEGGRVLLGCPGAPGGTGTGFAESACGVWTLEQNEAAGVAAANSMANILFFIGSDESLPLNTNIFKNSFQVGGQCQRALTSTRTGWPSPLPRWVGQAARPSAKRSGVRR